MGAARGEKETTKFEGANTPARSKPAVDWHALEAREERVIHLVARRYPQKAVAMKLGLSPASVSKALRSARLRLGFRSANELVGAFSARVGAGRDDQHRR